MKLKIDSYSVVKKLIGKNKKGKSYNIYCIYDTFYQTYKKIPFGEVEYYRYITRFN